MNGYLIPANAKKGTLIFNIFRPFDLMLFSGGILVTLLALAFVPATNMLLVVIAMLPVMVTGVLVFPVPNYHNVMCALFSIYRFYTERRKYVWKGWCFYERFPNDEPKGSNRAKENPANK